MNRPRMLLTVILVVLLLLPVWLDKYALGILVMIYLYAFVGQSWNVLTGYTGHISLGHALWLGLGAYTSTYLAMRWGLSPWLGMWVGGVLAAVVALFQGLLGFRFGLRGVYFVILTIAFGEIGRILVAHVKELGSFSGLFLDFKPGFINFQFRSNVPYYYISLGMMVGSTIVVRFIEKSRLGRLMIAVREDEQAAEALGVNAFKISMIAIAISAFMTSLAGTFYANYIFYIHPNTMFSTATSIDIILRPIIGGMGTVLGPIVGSFILTPLSEVSRAYLTKGGLEGLHLVLYGLLTILVVLFMRQGVMVYLQRALKGILKIED